VRGQKQVALLVKPAVPVQRLYQITLEPAYDADLPAAHLLRIDNRIGKELAEPLPSGAVAVFEQAAGERRYAGATELRDHAVGETVNLLIGESAQVRLAQAQVAGDASGRNWEAVLTNANPFAVTVEVRFDLGDGANRATTLSRLPRKDGFALWAVSVPANGTRTLPYRRGK
jgi:hypothetical protein